MTASPVKVVVQSLLRKGGLKLSKVQVCVVEKCMLIVIDCVEEFFEKKKEKKKMRQFLGSLITSRSSAAAARGGKVMARHPPLLASTRGYEISDYIV